MHNGSLAYSHSPISAAPPRPVMAADDTADKALIGKIAAGDRLAMRTLYARHTLRVYRFVLRLIGDEARAEDVVSEVFLDVWRQAGRFAGRSQVSTWILAIARYKAISVLRERQHEMLDDEVAEGVADDSEDPQAALLQKDAGILLQKCLRQLSPEHREIIDLVYYHEKSVEEAAAIVGIPRNSVKTRMFYARKRMSELYERVGGQRTWQ
jgi:RNA polymerase sigma-70 factor, ECF subfamily